MPFHVSIIPELQHSRFKIWPEPGWGWKTCGPEGQRVIENIPTQPLSIRFERMAFAGAEPVGFHGQMIEPAATHGFGEVLCLLHTCEWISKEAPSIPVSIHCAHGPLSLREDPLAPTGVRPVWTGVTGVIDFGHLVLDGVEHPSLLNQDM